VDVRQFVNDGWKIWCISVEDKFGDNGITGCVMVNPNLNDNLNEVEVDTFLLSCRILGKGIEVAFIKKILSMLKDDGIEEVRASYVPTAKNAQVKEFYEKCGFACVNEETDGKKSYMLDLADVDLQIKDYYHISVK
jgi:FkbH-like protein